jgi:carbonic anhydrase/acetyltransferase-like protein (isoleucine patch superfamily)
VIENAKLLGYSPGCYSRIRGEARLSGNSVVNNPIEITGRISENARVTEGSSVMGNAEVGGNANISKSTVSDEARVSGNANVTNGSIISENSVVTDDAKVSAAEIRGTATISGESEVEDGAVVCDSATVTDHAVVKKNAVIAGQSVIKDRAVVLESARVLGESIISGTTATISYKDYSDYISAESRSLSAAPSSKELTGTISPIKVGGSDVQEVCLKLDGLEKEINTYGSDIVKLLKFPVMSDLRDENTLEMMLALKNSKSIDPESNPKKFRKAVNSLERKFMKAESNARIICATAFTDEQRKKAEKARDLFAVACDEASSEQEKKSAFKQGFRQLEGVVAITDSVVENMRIRVGIPELEA